MAICLLWPVCFCSAAFAARQVDAKQEIAGLVQRAVVAANTHAPTALAPFAANADADFKWVESKTTSVWGGGLLSVPGARANDETDPAEETLAIFHAWHTCESDGDHVHRLVHTADGWRIGKEIPESDPGPLRIVDHALDITLVPAENRALITDRVRIERIARPLSTEPLLRISQDFKVEEMRLGGPSGAVIKFGQTGGILAIEPPPGRAFTLWMRYSGAVKHDGSDYILPTEATLESYWYPTTARLPARSAVTAHVPANWTVVAQGEPVQGGPHTPGNFAFHNEIPVSFFTIDAAPYSITQRISHGKTLTAYLIHPNPILADHCLTLLEQTLEFYEARFAPFPYDRYGVVETAGPFQGAMEAYSFATFASGTLSILIPHELSHTWWGGLVPCTYTRSMWNESFAEYSDDLFHRENSRRPGLMLGRMRRSTRAQAELAKEFSSVSMADAFDTSDPEQNSVGYNKGAHVMRVLEHEIGKPVMMRCLAAFVTARRGRAPTDWPDFQRVVEQVTGRTYGWFFSEWIDRRGLPAAWLGDVTVGQPDAKGSRVVEGVIAQAGDPYRIDIPIRLEMKDGKVISRVVRAEGASTRYRFVAEAAPERIVMDPDNIIPLGPAPDSRPNDDLTIHLFDEAAALFERQTARAR